MTVVHDEPDPGPEPLHEWTAAGFDVGRARRWIGAGFPLDAALRWRAGGVHAPADLAEDPFQLGHSLVPLHLRLVVGRLGLALPCHLLQLGIHIIEDLLNVLGTGLDVSRHLGQVGELYQNSVTHDSHSPCLGINDHRALVYLPMSAARSSSCCE